jgi:NADPH:quinone reductase
VRALVVSHDHPTGLRLGEVSDPVPERDEALVRVAATTLNFGEVVHVLAEAPDGAVLGWDGAGVIVQSAANGTGPPVGTAVVTTGEHGGGWAELRAVRTDLIAPIPAGADPGLATTVPVAAGSALRALRRLGLLLGRQVMVTGASGGVGRFAVQLAAQAGAEVIAVARENFSEELAKLGAAQIIDEPKKLQGTVDAAIDMVGGDTLVQTYQRLRDFGGTVVSVGRASRHNAVFPPNVLAGDHRSMQTFYLYADTQRLAEDMTWLATQVHTGQLDPGISWRGPWQEAADAVAALTERRLHGKPHWTSPDPHHPPSDAEPEGWSWIFPVAPAQPLRVGERSPFQSSRSVTNCEMDIRSHADTWLAAWNAHDLDAIMACYSEEVDFVASTVVQRWGHNDGRLQGRAELRRHFELGLQLAPHLSFTEEAFLSSPVGYALLYRRENNNSVLDVVELDSSGDAARVRVFHEAPQL